MCLHGSYKIVRRRKTELDNERIIRGCIARNRVSVWGKFLNILDRRKNKVLEQNIRVFEENDFTFTIIIEINILDRIILD